MILDKTTLFADNLAYNGAPTVIDLLTVRPGPGEPLRVFVTGSPDLAGTTGITITDGTTDAAGDPLLSHTCKLAGQTIELELPSDTARYVKLELAGAPSAGTWSAGIALAGVQTNR